MIKRSCKMKMNSQGVIPSYKFPPWVRQNPYLKRMSKARGLLKLEEWRCAFSRGVHLHEFNGARSHVTSAHRGTRKHSPWLAHHQATIWKTSWNATAQVPFRSPGSCQGHSSEAKGLKVLLKWCQAPERLIGFRPLIGDKVARSSALKSG